MSSPADENLRAGLREGSQTAVNPQPLLRCALLVIGYGNTLRSDDGVGPRVADAIDALSLPNVLTLSLPLLAPELAEPLARTRTAIFVDAAVDAPHEVRLRKLIPAASSQIFAHTASPETLLALAKDIFGWAPDAWLLSIPVENLAIGEELSPYAQQGLETAINAIKNRSWQATHSGG